MLQQLLLGRSVHPVDVVKMHFMKWQGNAYMAAAYLRVVVKVVSSLIATLLGSQDELSWRYLKPFLEVKFSSLDHRNIAMKDRRLYPLFDDRDEFDIVRSATDHHTP